MPERWHCGLAAADVTGTGGSWCSESGEGWREAAQRAEDETVKEAWGASGHLEGGRC